MVDITHLLKLETARYGEHISDAVGLQKQFGKLLHEFDDTISILDQITVDNKITEFELDTSNKIGNVLIPMFQPGITRTIFAYAFKTRGYEPLIIRCDSDLPHCFRQQQDKYDNIRCTTCIHAGNTLVDKFGLNRTYLSNLLPENYTIPENVKKFENQKYKDVNISSYAMSSCRAYFKKYNIDLDNKEQQEIYEEFLRVGVMMVDLSNHIFDKYNIDAVVGSDAAYVYDGIMMNVADQYSIPAAVPSKGKRPYKIRFGFQSNREPLASYIDFKECMNYINKPLKKGERDQIDAIMKNRKKGKDLRTNHVKLADDTTTIPKFSEGTTFGLFTNLLWDASMTAEEGLFTDPFEWIDQTISMISTTDSNLIIKTHPAEIIQGTNESIYKWITTEYDSLPKSVKILRPDTTISPYQLIRDIDAGIVYNSTIGLEMAYEGIPAIVVGETHYRNLGFTFEPDSLNEYQSIIESMELAMTDEMQKKAQRYAYLYFVERHIDYPYHNDQHDSHMLIQHDNICPGNENFDKIIKGILEGGPIIDV